MKREYIKLMRPYSTRLVVKGQFDKRGNVLVFVRCVREKDGIIVIRRDYGKYDRDINVWVEDIREEMVCVDELCGCTKIPFRTVDGMNLFFVREFNCVMFERMKLNDAGDSVYDCTDVRRVIADGFTDGDWAYHFHFEDSGEIYHVDEFASKINPHGNRVRPIYPKAYTKEDIIAIADERGGRGGYIDVESVFQDRDGEGMADYLTFIGFTVTKNINVDNEYDGFHGAAYTADGIRVCTTGAVSRWK